MTYDITNTNVIYLGRQGENLARTVEIDVNSILGKWPNATISLIVQRNQEDTFYLPDVVIENGILKWTISNADTEFAGDGKAEIRATQDDVIVKSATMNTHVSDSLGGTETDIPDPAQTWADTIIAASEQAKQSAEDALASELAAKEAAESITELESNIKTAEAARVEAEKGRAMAESDRVAAEEMREDAEDARVEAEKERISAENERIDAEIARSNAETSRASAEHERQTAEWTRVSAETSRETAENNRATAETARVTAEQSRASAETTRESAETNRQTTFKTNEAQRQTAFNTAEASRAAAESSRVAAEEARVSAETGRVEAESERVDAENQRAETFAGYETRIDAAAPDDSAVDGKPWTSRKIVDTLCPPFDVSGSVVQCHPVEGYPLGVVSRIDATQSGSGDASPENVRPIVGWDSVKVNRCGKNLLDISKADAVVDKPYGLNVSINGNDITISGIPNVENKANLSFAVCWIGQPELQGKGYKITSFGSDKIISIYGLRTTEEKSIAVYMALDPNVEINETIQIMVSVDTPTAYEPYTGDTYTAALPETVYGGELDWETGVLTVEWVTVHLDGSENWITPESRAYYAVFGYRESANTSEGFCSHYPYTNKSSAKSVFANKNGAVVFYNFNADHTLDAFKAHLAEQYAAGTPVQICYKIANPYTIQLTPQQITALSGVNTLYTDSGDTSVSGRTDMIWLTQSLIDRIAALETAAVSE